MKVINNYINALNDTVYKFDHGYFAICKNGVLKVYTNKCNLVAPEIYRLAKIAITKLKGQ
jgi:hypothetical protein